ncbi:hypothetical protein VTO73DRAFT_15212 [Trametes versicolor]
MCLDVKPLPSLSPLPPVHLVAAGSYHAFTGDTEILTALIRSARPGPPISCTFRAVRARYVPAASCHAGGSTAKAAQ